MSQHYEQRAEAVVKGFLELLDEPARATLDKEHLDELSIMIESAISTAVLDQLEAVADELSDLAVLVRRRAERYEGGPSSD